MVQALEILKAREINSLAGATYPGESRSYPLSAIRGKRREKIIISENTPVV